MTAATQPFDIESQASVVAPVGDDAVAEEIRVVQSVQIQRNMPVLLLGNALGVLIFFYVDWSAALASQAVYFLAAELLLLLPMLRSYLRLRGRPRPEQVSRRRIRTLQAYSFVLGLVWAVAIMLMLPHLSQVNGIVILMVVFFLGYGAVALTPSMLLAAGAYFGPMLLAAFNAAYFADILSVDLLILLSASAVAAMGRTLRQSWQDVATTVRTALERIAAETALHRREAEAALRDKERQAEITETQRRLIDAIPFPLVMSRGNELLPMGEQAARLFKVGLEEIEGHTVTDFFVEPDEQQRMIDLQSANGQLDAYEVQLKDAEGTPMWVMVSSRPLEYEGEPCWLNSMLLIDERKKAEEALAEKEAQLRLVMDHMQGGIRLVDQDRTYVFFNRQYLDLYDFPEGLLKAGQSSRIENHHQAQRGDFGSGDPDVLTDSWLQEHPVLDEPQGWERTTVFGKTLQVRTSPTPAGGFVSIVTDVTDRKRIETELLEAKQRAEEANARVLEQNQILGTVSNQLAKYISPQLYQAIFSGEQKVEIESRRKKLTVFFSDIVGFTSTTDQLESEELTALLNRYLTEMSAIALEYGATIDKFIGDAMMLYFGDPESRGVQEDATACVRMAIAMQRRMRELQTEWREQGLEQTFELRIGVNTGYCTVGNFGSEDRMDYTIIGNEVNLAARIQSLAEVGGVLLANETHSLVKDWLLAEEGEAITVKGFTKPVRTFRVQGLYDDLEIEGRVIHREQDGVTLTIDRDRLHGEDKARAIRTLEEVLGQLKE
ncbi:MAG: adenylate/guanylate cyclase domain-containing protein [Alphaproteobacteria bacterium]|jgi:PAS domain S-box-containing protein|nr:adenylate/guanylate cyclase domain-containing protein [Alphaproteobacteria bacterium]MDP6815482.1 adenylate/guanylate cyclase domain-containing protein [Alphaproteobacteria bacterium]